ncbi:MAG: hypothetical protein ABII00_11465 [Elusimicrobiota bacterium]
MFFALLLVTLCIAVGTCYCVTRLFDNPIEAILRRIVREDLSRAWKRYIQFAIYVAGVSAGVRIHTLERYVTGTLQHGRPIVLDSARWTLEVYRALIGTLQGLAWLLLVFFAVAMIAYVIVRCGEIKRARRRDWRRGP